MSKIVYNYPMDAVALRALLSASLVPDLRWFDAIGSTNVEAMHWAAAEAPDGALVAADQQSAGKGRLGRKWITNPGGALAFSLIIRPSLREKEILGLFSPLCGLAVALALEGLGLSPQIKWPNDVLLSRRKTCGILAESVWLGDTLQALVLGIGVNVAPSSVPPAPELIFPATCVESERGASVDRFALLAAILESFFAWRPRLGQDEFLQAWQTRLAFCGEQVTVSQPDQDSLSGELLGVDAQGALRLRPEGEAEISILAGDVHLRPNP
jgi:BirA family transcriptional regulator, biotin operon repressor / biotin---[acetyl-CoA-carboxylase] ligase